MNLTGILRVQEKVAASEDFSIEEIYFLLDAISVAVVQRAQPQAAQYSITQAQIDRLHGAAHGGAMLGGDAAYNGCLRVEAILVEVMTGLPRSEPPTVTPSCGCIFCDLDIELHEDEQGFHHVIKGSRFNCMVSKP